jgi:hypothetical protein
MTETETKWSERVKEWKASGQTAKAFAHGRDFKPSTLTYWAHRVRQMARHPAAPPTSGEHTVAWCARRSSSAVVSFSSPPKTLTHSLKARFVVTGTLLRSYRSAKRLKSSSPPARSKGTKPNSSITRRSTAWSRR